MLASRSRLPALLVLAAAALAAPVAHAAHPSAKEAKPRVLGIGLYKAKKGPNAGRALVRVRIEHGSYKPGRHQGRLRVALRRGKRTAGVTISRRLHGSLAQGDVEYRKPLSRRATRRLLGGGKPRRRAGASAATPVRATVAATHLIDGKPALSSMPTLEAVVVDGGAWPPPQAAFGNGWSDPYLYIGWTEQPPYRAFVSSVSQASCDAWSDTWIMQPGYDSNNNPTGGYLNPDGSFSTTLTYYVWPDGYTGSSTVTGNVTRPNADGTFPGSASATWSYSSGSSDLHCGNQIGMVPLLSDD